jgi:hypothetical protein
MEFNVAILGSLHMAHIMQISTLQPLLAKTSSHVYWSYLPAILWLILAKMSSCRKKDLARVG